MLDSKTIKARLRHLGETQDRIQGSRGGPHLLTMAADRIERLEIELKDVLRELEAYAWDTADVECKAIQERAKGVLEY